MKCETWSANNNNHNRVSISTIDSEKKMIDHTLQELEKQLLDDNDEDEETGGGGSDAVSVITKTNSEWSETMQNLMGPNNNNNPATQKPVSPSPTSSSSSSSSVASPVTLTCSKQSLMEAAATISEGKTEAAAEILTRLTQVTTPRPNSEQRLLEFMAAALKSRVNPVDNPPPVKKIYSPEHSESTQILYELSPLLLIVNLTNRRRYDKILNPRDAPFEPKPVITVGSWIQFDVVLSHYGREGFVL